MVYPSREGVRLPEIVCLWRPPLRRITCGAPLRMTFRDVAVVEDIFGDSFANDIS